MCVCGSVREREGSQSVSCGRQRKLPVDQVVEEEPEENRQSIQVRSGMVSNSLSW